jgi:FAS-associated factor 2
MSTPDISQLNSAQQEALQTYTAVTDQDPIAAIPLLQRCEWNVQIAIARFFDGEPAIDPVAEARAALPATSARQTANLQYEYLLSSTRPSTTRQNLEDVVERVDTSAAAETQYRPSFLFSLIFTPVNIIYRVFTTVFSPLGFLVPTFLSRLFNRLLYQQSRPVRRALPPAENSRRFIREFSEEYGQNTLPFQESGFNLTLDNAKKDLKFLLVVLLSPSHDENHTWVQETLLSNQLKSFLHSHRDELVLWGGNVRDSEAYQVSASIQCTKFPFAALICQTTESGSSAMTVIMRAAGPMPASELVAKLGTALTAHQAQLGATRAQRAEQEASRNLREEQDSAYERSLAQDRERARRRREEQEAAERAQREAQEQARLAEEKKQKVAQWKQWRAQTLPAEPGTEVKDAIRVSIRMPSGERVIRKFRAEADLDELYAFVDCHDNVKSREGGEASGESVDEPANYSHEYGFRLVSPMPRAVIELHNGGSIGERIGRGANLIVEPIEEDGEGTGEE